MGRTRRVLICVASLAALTTLRPVAAEPTADEFAQAVQKKYDGIRDFSADFVHAYEGGALHKKITERGRLFIKKPGKMRWEYTAPEAKLFVSDGMKMYSYLPADNQVIVSSIPRENEATTPTLFLAGKGNLTKDFTSSLVELPKGMPAGSRTLKLVPKARQRDYDWLMLVVDPATLAFRGLVTVDSHENLIELNQLSRP